VVSTETRLLARFAAAIAATCSFDRVSMLPGADTCE
jgi:hypothetical protein